MKKSAHMQHGFTLVEMLVVLVIIGMLAGLVGPKLFGRVDSSKVKTAEVQIKMQEVLRALVIDKDHQPKWNPPTLEQVTDAMVAQFFASPWPARAHPLRDL